VPDLLGRREIDLPQAGPKTNELIAKHVYTRGFVLVCTLYYVILVTAGQ